MCPHMASPMEYNASSQGVRVLALYSVVSTTEYNPSSQGVRVLACTRVVLNVVLALYSLS